MLSQTNIHLSAAKKRCHNLLLFSLPPALAHSPFYFKGDHWELHCLESWLNVSLHPEHFIMHHSQNLLWLANDSCFSYEKTIIKNILHKNAKKAGNLILILSRYARSLHPACADNKALSGNAVPTVVTSNFSGKSRWYCHWKEMACSSERTANTAFSKHTVWFIHLC